MTFGERLKNFVCNHKSIVISTAINTFFLLMLLWFNGVQYELSDDMFFSMNIANGDYNYIFCNYFIQYLSGVLQQLIYPLNAFMLLQLVLGFVGMTSITYILLEIAGYKKGLFLVLLLESAFAINVYSLITFTKTAAVLLTAGAIMIFWAVCEKKKLRYSVFGLIMVLLGSFYRFKIFYSVIAVFGFFVLGYLAYRTEKPYVKGFLAECKQLFTIKTVLILLVLFVSVFSFKGISNAIIYSDEEVKEYAEYNTYRSSVVDFRFPSYGSHWEEYDALGITEADITMVRQWYFDDEGVASLDKLKKLTKMQENRQTERAYLSGMYHVFVGAPENLFFIVYILVVVGILTLYNKKSLIHIFFVTFGVGLLYLYLYLIGRCNYRVTFSMWFAVIVCLMYSCSFLKAKVYDSKKQFLLKRIAAIGGVFLYLFFFGYGLRITAPELMSREGLSYPELEEYIVSCENSVFALGRNPYLNFRNSTLYDNPLLVPQNEAFEKCVYFGTPYYKHPSYTKLLKSKGIDNLYTALADMDNLYFVDDKSNHIKLLVGYLNRYYGEDRSYFGQPIINVAEFKIYKIITYDK